MSISAHHLRAASRLTLELGSVQSFSVATRATLPGGCSTVRVGGVAYSQCGPTYDQRVGSGYQVVVLR